MPVFHALVLGLVQGLTEFFPISSSGHLILVPALLGWKDQGVAFDTVLHLGTLTALLWFFWKDLWALALAAFKKDVAGTAARRFIGQCVVASLPILVVGYFLGGLLEATNRVPWVVASSLLFWGALLFLADHVSAVKPEERGWETVSWKHALLVGFVQPIALIPGTSRSGITITAGLLSGLSREVAARFSFFVSIPVTAVAGFYGLSKILGSSTAAEPAPSAIALLVGFVTAAIVGGWAIRFLISYVSKKHYDVFVVYRLALAIVVLLLV